MYATPNAKIGQNRIMKSGLGMAALNVSGQICPNTYPTMSAVTPTISPG